MTLGAWNPLPATLGGADPPLREAYLALRSAVGDVESNASGPSFEGGGIEDGWRFAKARGISMAGSVVEAAASEFTQDQIVHNLALWEQSLLLGPRDIEQDRREAIAQQIASPTTAIIPKLQDLLRARFADNIVLKLIERDVQAYAYRHRSLGDRSGVVGFGPRPSSPGPSFSTAYVLRVCWPKTPLMADEVQSIRRVVRNAVPSWWRVIVQNSISSGFVLGDGSDGSLLGQRGLGG